MDKMYIKSLLLFLVFAGGVSSLMAQKNEVKSYIVPGYSIVYDSYLDINGLYTRHMTDRLDLTGGVKFSTKRKSFFSSLTAEARYRFPISKGSSLYVMTGGNYTAYSEFHLNEYIWRVAGKFESPYFDFEFGNCLFYYTSYGNHETEAFTPSIQMNLRFRKLSAPWSVGLFARNFDDFYYDNYNVTWGINGYKNINSHWNVIGEFAVRPAGTLSQLATKYERYFKFGAIYKW